MKMKTKIKTKNSVGDLRVVPTDGRPGGWAPRHDEHCGDAERLGRVGGPPARGRGSRAGLHFFPFYFLSLVNVPFFNLLLVFRVPGNRINKELGRGAS